MDQQAVQVWRRRSLNIAEVAFYSVLVAGITLVSVYVPAGRPTRDAAYDASRPACRRSCPRAAVASTPRD
jgi:hypothetical protein